MNKLKAIEASVQKNLLEIFDEEIATLVARQYGDTWSKLLFLMDTHNLWGAEGVYTFPDGDVLQRSEVEAMLEEAGAA